MSQCVLNHPDSVSIRVELGMLAAPVLAFRASSFPFGVTPAGFSGTL